MSPLLTLPLSTFEQQDYADEYDLPLLGGRLKPGETEKGAITFEVSPSDATDFILVPN